MCRIVILKMKNMNRLTMMLLWLMVSAAATAQGKIDKIVKEIESKGVEATVVVKRNSESKKMYLRIQTYFFRSKNGKYANQLVEAFREESEDADEAIMNKPVKSFIKSGQTGTTKHYELVFTEKKVKKIYMLDVASEKDGDPFVQLQIVMRDGNVPANKGDYKVFKYDLRDLSDATLLKADEWNNLFSKNNVHVFELPTDSLKGINWQDAREQFKELKKQLEPYRNINSKTVVLKKHLI